MWDLWGAGDGGGEVCCRGGSVPAGATSACAVANHAHWPMLSPPSLLPPPRVSLPPFFLCCRAFPVGGAKQIARPVTAWCRRRRPTVSRLPPLLVALSDAAAPGPASAVVLSALLLLVEMEGWREL